MPHYLHQVGYSREGWQALVKHPQDRVEVIKPAIEKLGGKIKSAWFAFGEYDVVVITEMPDKRQRRSHRYGVCCRRSLQGRPNYCAALGRGSCRGHEKGEPSGLSTGNGNRPRSLNYGPQSLGT